MSGGADDAILSSIQVSWVFFTREGKMCLYAGEQLTLCV